MAYDLLHNRHRDGPEDGDPDRTRTPEEEAMLARAREEAARRASQRREGAGEVNDLLGDMLDASAPPRAERDEQEAGRPEAGEDLPAIDLDLGADDGSAGQVPSGLAASEEGAAPSPFAALSEPGQEPPPIRRPTAVRLDPEAARPREGPAGRELSPLMRKVLRDLRELGAVSRGAQFDFEPESSAAGAEQTMELLAVGRRRAPAGIDFEPAESAEDPGTRVQAGRAAGAVPRPGTEPGATGPGDDQPGPREAGEQYSLDDLPAPGAPAQPAEDEDEPAEQAPEGDALPGGELEDAGLLDASAADRRKAPGPVGGEHPGGESPESAYSLEDLPPAPAAGSQGEEGPAPPDEAPMTESSLDEQGLDAALAAALPPSAGPQDAESASPPGGPSPNARRSEAGPQAPVRSYGLEDLPEVPENLASTLSSEEGGGSSGGGEQLPDQPLPDLMPPASEAPADGGLPSAGFTAVERALDGTGGSADPGTSAGSAPRSEPAPQLSGAERAADLSVAQLAAVEQMLERDAERLEAESFTAAAGGSPQPRLAFLLRWVQRGYLAVTTAAASLRGAVDRRLEPYSLSCRILLGIAGILILAVVGVLSIKTWVLPVWFQPMD
jgi:hypothetical protein